MKSFFRKLASIINRRGVCRRQLSDVRRACLGSGEHWLVYVISIGIIPVNYRTDMNDWERIEFRAFRILREPGGLAGTAAVVPNGPPRPTTTVEPVVQRAEGRGVIVGPRGVEMGIPA